MMMARMTSKVLSTKFKSTTATTISTKGMIMMMVIPTIIIPLLGLLLLSSAVHGFEIATSTSRRRFSTTTTTVITSKQPQDLHGLRHHSQQQYRHQRFSSCILFSSTSDSTVDPQLVDLTKRLATEGSEIIECVSISLSPFFGKDKDELASPEGIVKICDLIDAESKGGTFENDDIRNDGSSLSTNSNPQRPWVSSKSSPFPLRTKALEFQRYESLVNMMKSNYTNYVVTASFLSPSRIPRRELPNVQDVPLGPEQQQPQQQEQQQTSKTVTLIDEETGLPLVADCELDDVKFEDSLLDKLLLSIFRDLVTENTGGVTSSKNGIEGLLDQARKYMLQPGQTPEAQHTMVRKTLGGLMTPVLPPFYRIFMSGIIPKSVGGEEWGGKQVGPWFYAPFLTAFVTPTFFQFLVGPSFTNRRKDGQPGGLVVEKCKFLQESGCKGMCLNICKVPAQQFFKDDLGLDLTVSPNFVTQECQWSFGEQPLPPDEDPSFPKGCLVGCESRKALVAAGSNADLCS